MKLVPAKCTQCGAILQVDKEKDAWICEHCGMPFIVEKAIQNLTVTVVPGQAMADKLFDDAEALLSFGDYSKAQQKFVEMTEQFPRDWRGWFGVTRACCLTCLSNGKYDPGFVDIDNIKPLYEMVSFRRALACNADSSVYIPFFTQLLAQVENAARKPMTEMPPNPRQQLRRGEHLYSFENYAPPAPIWWRDSHYDNLNTLAGPVGTYYQPSGLLCWFVMYEGPGQMIRMLNDADLNARANALIAAFKTGFLNGSFVGKDFQWMAELYNLAQQRKALLANNPRLLLKLLKQAGIKTNEHRGEATVIGRTLLLRTRVDYSDYDDYACYILPTVIEI